MLLVQSITCYVIIMFSFVGNGMASCSYLTCAGHTVKTVVFHGTVSLSYTHTRPFPLVVLCNGEGAGSPDYGTVSLASQPTPPLCERV